MKTTIGGDRLGSGNKQNVSMRNYERSTHDLSYTWRSSMAAGTLVPFMSRLALPGDTWDINLNCEVLTLPTLGPLFGSFKVQLDVFQVPIRLYNARLHNNELGIGMNMSDVHLPIAGLRANDDGTRYADPNAQVNPSSLWKYLGVSGIGRVTDGVMQSVERDFNAVPYLGFWDIFKNYYANKQEEDFYFIHSETNNVGIPIEGALSYSSTGFGIPRNFFEEGNATDVGLIFKVEILFKPNSDIPRPSGVRFNLDGVPFFGDDLFEEWTYDRLTGVLTGTEPTDAFVGIGYVEAGNVLPESYQVGDIRLFKNKLEIIDNMRKAILRHPDDSVPFVINTADVGQGGTSIYNSWRTSVDNPDGRNPVSIEFPQEGLPVKTYQSDLFNNWISTEWIDGPNGVNEITKVDTTGDAFTIDALNLAQKVYVMLNRIAISGGTYDDWLDAVYTHKRTKGMETPVYMGSLIKELAFQEVVSNSLSQTDTEKQPLGSLAGRGRLTGKNKGGQIYIKVDEPSYIMGIVSLTPRVDYSNGNQFDLNLKTLDDLHKPQLDAIGYQDLITDQIDWRDTIAEHLGSPNLVFQSAGKQPAWINYMTDVNRAYGNFAEPSMEMYMTLNRRYEADVTGIKDLTTYIDPTKFNNIFAEVDLSSQNFWVQIAANVTARRKMSAKVIPNL